MYQDLHPEILEDPGTLIQRIDACLNGNGIAGSWPTPDDGNSVRGSAVLFLLTSNVRDGSKGPEICVLLNKRSRRVLQPGDLCCPGGGVEKRDRIFSRFLSLPYSPLYKWSRRHPRQTQNRLVYRRIAMLLATGLREAWEEMRLNPLRVSFLGPLPVQQLVMFDRKIYPLAAWIPARLSLKTNQEVDRIVRVPLRRLLDPGNYGRYQPTFTDTGGIVLQPLEFPCFIHNGLNGTEILWGATFRITMNFLSLVFGFSLPDMESLPLVKGRQEENYLNGSVLEQRK